MEEQMSNRIAAQKEALQGVPEDEVKPGFDQLFKEATNIWKANLADLVLVTLVFCLLAWIPVVNFVFGAGYVRSLLKAVRGERPEVADLFSAWDRFGSALVYGLAVFAGMFVLMMVPGVLGWVGMLVLFMLVSPGFFAIADRNLDPLSAVRWGIAAFKTDIGNWVAVLLVGVLIAKAGMLLLLIGVMLTIPWGYLLIALQYDRQGELEEFEES